MLRKHLARITATLVGATLLTSCAGAVTDEYVIENDPGHATHIPGTDLSRVTLTAVAAERLGIRTVPVTTAGKHLVVPATAVFVDPDGAWWVYTSPAPQEFVRHEVSIEREHDGLAMLTAGPSDGTDVVTVGVAELYGVEAAVGH